MKKIFALFLLILYLIPISFAEEANKVEEKPKTNIENKIETENVTEPNEEQLTNFILKRKEKVEQILWISQEKNSLEKKYQEIINNLEAKKNNDQVTKEVIDNLQKNFENINKSINEKNKEIEELNNQIKNQWGNFEELVKQKTIIEWNLSNLTKEKSDLETKIASERQKTLVLESEMAELEIYKNRYEELLKKQNQNERLQTELHLAVYAWIIILFVVILWFGGWLIKDKHNKSLFRVVSSFVFVLVFIGYTVIVNPWVVVILVIVAGSIVLSFKDFIVWFVGSAIIIRKFKVWDEIEVKWIKGKINSVTAFNTELVDENWETYSIWNASIISETIKNINPKSEKKETGKIIFETRREHLNMRLQQIFEVCKWVNPKFHKDKDIKYEIEEKKRWILRISVEITNLHITNTLTKIFHESFKNKITNSKEDEPTE